METKVRYLVDTNVWLERLLDQEKSEIASKFLDLIPTDELFVSDFSIHSYQLSIAQKYDLTIITFDKDFNVKGIKKNSPDEIIEKQ